MAAAVAACDGDLRFAAHDADDARTERPRPLAEDEPDAARGGVHQQPVAALHAHGAAQQIVRGEPFEHQHRGLFVADGARQLDDPLGRQVAQLAVAAGLRVHIGHAVADAQTAHAPSDGGDDAGGLSAETGGQRHRVEARAVVDVDVVQADGRVAQLHLARPGRAWVEVLELQDLGTSGLVETDGFGHQRRSAARIRTIKAPTRPSRRCGCG